MQTYRQCAAARLALSGRVALAAIAALALLALGAIAVPSHARAGSGDPKITFVAPVYAGQNNGFAEGPVGANVSVQGSGWTGGGGDVTISLADEQNDTSGQPGSACTNGSPTVPIAGLSQPVDSSGNFTFAPTFQWPAAAGVQGHSYWACGTQGGATSQGVDKFTVLSSAAPSIAISVAQAAVGSTITVDGQNWLPAGITVHVIIAPCVACEPPYSSSAQATSNGSTGSFSVSVQVPPAAAVGTVLYVSAQNVDPANDANTGALNTGASKSTSFTVIAQATPTPTAPPTPNATVSATATSASNVGGAGGNTNSSSGNTVLIVLLAALGVVLLLGAIVAIILFLRSRNPAPVKGGSPYRRYPPPGGQYGGPRRTGGAYGPPSYPDTNAEYYDGPLRSGPQGQGRGRAGGWPDASQEPGFDDGSGDDPTIGMRTPWRR